MFKKEAIKVCLPVMLLVLAVVPAAVMAQEGGEGEMADEEMMMAAVSCQQDYTVQADDWLSKIAEKFYGDVLAFPAIADATNAHHDAAMMMAGDKEMMAEGDETMMAEKESMAGEEMMASDKLMLAGSDGQMMEAMMDANGNLMVKSSDGQMMDVMMDAEGHMMNADGSMVEGKLVLESADGHMMDVMMMDGKLMTTDADGEMMDVAMDGEMMAEDEAMMEDKAMAGEEAMMMDDGYALVENPDIIEPGWTLCIPSPEDAQALLAEKAMMAQ